LGRSLERGLSVRPDRGYCVTREKAVYEGEVLR
jgi:hypothetical protein